MNLKEDLELYVAGLLIGFEMGAEGADTGDRVTTFNELLWEFLQDKIGPVQEKLVNQIDMLRAEKRQLETRVEVLANELAKLQQAEDS